MKIAVLGGSFNPLHIGHLALADEVCVSLGYDKVLFIPAYCPPHKEMNDAESGKDRFEMIRLACAADERFEAENCELERGGISYTYDTICHLEKKYASRLEGHIGLVIGQDLAGEFYKWHNAEALARKTDIILAHRPSDSTEHEEEFVNKPCGVYTGQKVPDSALDTFPYPHTVLDNPVFPVSSTDIRRRIVCGKSWRYLVPGAVYRYIIQRKLYGYDEYAN